MAGEGRSPSIKSESYYGGGGGSSTACGTPRLHWRSVSWTARSREREAEASGSQGSSARPASMGTQQNAKRGELDTDLGGSSEKGDFSKHPNLLIPPLSSLSVSRRADFENNSHGAAIVGEEKKAKKIGRGRNGLDIKLDLGAVRQVNFQENDAAEPSDSELSQKREKMALCEKQCSRVRSHLYFGSSMVAQDFEMLRSNKITHIVNCVGYVCAEYFPNNFHYRVLWLQDSPSEDIFSILYDCFDYFEDVKDQGGRVYVHCCQGVSRSAAIVIAYLMWREGRTFEDVFEDVKALRSVTSPNMGFVFQLINWQSRVLGSPKTPSLRMFRMAPHSPYDPLHMVPKGVAHPSMSSLDSRGAFVIQFANRLYVWLGRLCGRCVSAAADKVAFQLIRYERALGPILLVREGSEPPELYSALMNSQHLSGGRGGGELGNSQHLPGQGDGGELGNSPVATPSGERLTTVSENSPSAGTAATATSEGAGARHELGNETSRGLVNHAYDADFEAFDKARSGEVLASLPDGTNLRGWDGRWNTPRHDFCCGVLSCRSKR